MYITSAPSRSSSIASLTPGNCTFTATSRRSLVSARWTWPMLAAATGRSSQRRKICSGGAPSSASTTEAASVGAIGAALACRAASACWASSGNPSAMKLTSWPTFISTPFISPSSLATSSAVRMANWVSSSARRSAGVTTRRTRLAAKRVPLRAVIDHIRRERHDITFDAREPTAATSAPRPMPPAATAAARPGFTPDPPPPARR